MYARGDAGNIGNGFPVDFTIQTSPDGTNWTTQVARTGYGRPTAAAQSFSLTTVSARYVRVNANSLRANPTDNNSYYFQLAEFEVYGSAGTTTSPYTLIPAKIEAENGTLSSGLRTENTADAGGGLNVGYTSNGATMDYLINVPSSGSYNIDFRVAGNYTGSIQLKVGSTVLATVTVPNTGGWQSWQTVTASNVPLTAGNQDIQIYIVSAGWNLNWINFTSSPTSSAATQVSGAEIEPLRSSMSIYPNPLKNGALTIRVSDQTENALVRVYSSSGTLVYSTVLKKDAVTTIDRSKLKPGFYIVKISGNKLNKVEKLVVE